MMHVLLTCANIAGVLPKSTSVASPRFLPRMNTSENDPP